jgi:intraflagellar transport protein 172
MTNMAFVCWNRYLDLSEAIEEGEEGLQENSDFSHTDVPFDVKLPRENLAPELRDEVRNVRQGGGEEGRRGWS